MIRFEDKSGRVIAEMDDDDQEPKFFDEAIKNKKLEEEEETCLSTRLNPPSPTK